MSKLKVDKVSPRTGTYVSLNTVGMKNIVINGDMSISQRHGTSSVTQNDNIYSVDRFGFYASQSSKLTVQQNAGSVTPPSGFKNYLGYTSSSAYTVGSSETFISVQVIEGYNVAYLDFGTANAKSITLSFWVRSSLTGTFGGALRNADATRSYPFTYSISLANTWEKKSITFEGDTSGTWNTTNGYGLGLMFGLGVGSTLSSTAGSWQSGAYYSATGATSLVGTNGATFYITGVQLEAGTTASDFEFLPVDVNLRRCQRYYEKSYTQATTPGTVTNDGRNMVFFSNTGSGYVGGFVKYVVTKRTTPTITIYAPGNGASGDADFYIFGSSSTQASIVLNESNDVGFELYRNGTSCNAMAFHYQIVSEL